MLHVMLFVRVKTEKSSKLKLLCQISELKAKFFMRNRHFSAEYR